MKERKAMIERNGSQLSVRRQCELLAVNRNRLEVAEGHRLSAADAELCELIDRIHLKAPAFGSRKIRELLVREYGRKVGRGRVRRLMRLMGVRAIYRRPRTSLPGQGAEHRVYPYLLRDREIGKADEAWCADITYIPMGRGFAYLVVIMDWRTRAVLAWEISNTLDTEFCVRAFLKAVAVSGRVPEIFNTDQGCQFTSREWRELLESFGIRISMDGKGRWIDNVFVERLWRTLKYEEIYLRDYRDLRELERGLAVWFERYNTWRPHDSHDGARPWEIYRPRSESEDAA